MLWSLPASVLCASAQRILLTACVGRMISMPFLQVRKHEYREVKQGGWWSVVGRVQTPSVALPRTGSSATLFGMTLSKLTLGNPKSGSTFLLFR